MSKSREQCVKNRECAKLFEKTSSAFAMRIIYHLDIKDFSRVVRQMSNLKPVDFSTRKIICCTVRDDSPWDNTICCTDRDGWSFQISCKSVGNIWRCDLFHWTRLEGFEEFLFQLIKRWGDEEFKQMLEAAWVMKSRSVPVLDYPWVWDLDTWTEPIWISCSCNNFLLGSLVLFSKLPVPGHMAFPVNLFIVRPKLLALNTGHVGGVWMGQGGSHGLVQTLIHAVQPTSKYG